MRNDIAHELHRHDADSPASPRPKSLTDRGCSCLLLLMLIIGALATGLGVCAFVFIAGLPTPSTTIGILALVCGLIAAGIYIWAHLSGGVDAMSMAMNCFWAVLIVVAILTMFGSRLRSAGVKAAVKPSQPDRTESHTDQTSLSKPF